MMRGSNIGTIAGITVAVLFVIFSVWIIPASSDNITNDLNSPKIITFDAGSTATFKVKIVASSSQATAGDPEPKCNVDGTANVDIIIVRQTGDAVLTATPNPIPFTTCNDYMVVTLSSPDTSKAGSFTLTPITASPDSDGGVYHYEPFGTVTVNVRSSDNVPPDTLIDESPEEITNNNVATFAFHSTEAGSTFECDLDGLGFSACNSGTIEYGPLEDSSHTFKVQATDAAHNTDSTPAEFTWVIDTEAPTVDLTSSSPDPTSANPIPVTALFSDPVTGFGEEDIAVTNGAVVPGSLAGGPLEFTFNVAPTADGQVTVDVAAGAAKDGAGNDNTAATTLTRTFDGTAPVITVTPVSKIAKTVFTAFDPNLQANVVDAVDTDPTIVVVITPPAPDGFMAGVDYTVTRTATDDAGNSASQPQAHFYDKRSVSLIADDTHTVVQETSVSLSGYVVDTSSDLLPGNAPQVPDVAVRMTGSGVPDSPVIAISGGLTFTHSSGQFEVQELNEDKWLSVPVGTIVDLPSGINEVILDINDIGTKPFEIEYTNQFGDVNSISSSGLGSGYRILSIPPIKTSEEVRQIKFKSLDSLTTGNIGITRLVANVPDGDPVEQFLDDFSGKNAGTIYTSPFIFQAGRYFSPIIAPADASLGSITPVLPQWEVKMQTDENDLYKASDPVITKYDTLERNIDQNAAGLGDLNDISNIYDYVGSIHQAVGCGADADKDGICDEWEDGVAPEGIPVTNPVTQATTYVSLCHTDQFSDVWNGTPDKDNVNINKAAGLNICPTTKHKDIFVEIDYMTYHDPNLNALRDVIKAFGKSPITKYDVLNANFPDAFNRIQGITLHIVISDSMPHLEVLNAWQDPTGVGGVADDNNWNNDFRHLKAQYLGTQAIRASASGQTNSPSAPIASALSHTITLSGTSITTPAGSQLSGTINFNIDIVGTGQFTILQRGGTNADGVLNNVNKIQAVHVNAGSELIGMKVDSIVLGLKKTGSPSGTATVGVFDSSGNVKYTFGTLTVSTLTTSYQEKSFTGASTYTIVQGDFIGIQYTAGTASSTISVATSTTNQYDGALSARAVYTTAWSADTTTDLGSSAQNGKWELGRIKISSIGKPVLPGSGLTIGTPTVNVYTYGDGSDNAKRVINVRVPWSATNALTAVSIGSVQFTVDLPKTRGINTLQASPSSPSVLTSQQDSWAQGYMHYGQWVHNYGNTCGPGGSVSSGLAELGGNDFLISLGCNFNGIHGGNLPGSVGDEFEQAGTFMHELGHTLSLGHGGPTKVGAVAVNTADYEMNGKPNYLSVMSYPRQLSGGPQCPPNCYLYADTAEFLQYGLDYSRQALPAVGGDIREGTAVAGLLSEASGIGNLNQALAFYPPGAGGKQQVVIWATPSLEQTWQRANIIATGGTSSGVNWDTDLTSGESNINVDTNYFIGILNMGPSSASIMKGFDDWSNLQLNNRGAVGAWYDGSYGNPHKKAELSVESAENLQDGARQFVIIEPVNLAGPNIYKTGSSVPIKMKLFEPNGVTPDPDEQITLIAAKGNTACKDGQTLGVMVYDTVTQRYNFIWNTGKNTAGDYKLCAVIDKGSPTTEEVLDGAPKDGVTVYITLKK